MTAATKAVPDGFHTVTPHLVVRDANRAIEFYKQAFGAKELSRMPGPDGKSLMHAELQIGDSRVMLVDEFPGMGALSPLSVGGTSVTIHLYVNDVDVVTQRAISAGATVKMPVADMFWGDRYGVVSDPFGHQWSIATHKQDLTPAEMQQAAAKAMAQMGGQ
jgi:PhnB protein